MLKAHQTSMIISTVPPIDLPQLPHSNDIILRYFVSILESDTAPTPLSNVYILKSTLAASYTRKICVFLDEINRHILHDMDATAFDAIKAITTNSNRIR